MTEPRRASTGAYPLLREAAVRADLYRAVWRWHFYAGLLVLPFLAWLAITGSLYLYKPEIERAFYGPWLSIASHTQTPSIAPPRTAHRDGDGWKGDTAHQTGAGRSGLAHESDDGGWREADGVRRSR